MAIINCFIYREKTVGTQIVGIAVNMVVPGPQEPGETVYNPPNGMFTDAHVPDFDAYLSLYKKSIEEPEGTACHLMIKYSASVLLNHCNCGFLICRILGGCCTRVFLEDASLRTDVTVQL